MKKLTSTWTNYLSIAVTLVLGVVLFANMQQHASALGGQERIAYYGNWDIYSNNLFLKNLDTSGDASRLTTLVYSFENIDPTNLTCFQTISAASTNDFDPSAGDGAGDAWADYQAPFSANNSVNGQADSPTQALRGNFNQLKELKAKYPHLKILLSIGGWTFSKYFSDAAATSTSRTNFVNSCVDMYIRGNLPTGVAGDATSGGAGVAKGIFDGIDIDWEFPGSSNGHIGNHTSPNDTANYTALLSEFRSQLNTQGTADGKHYLLTAALPSGGSDTNLIQASQIQSSLDWGDIMSYDMHGSWEGSGPTNFQAPLYPSLNDPDASAALSVTQSIQRWENAGFAANKLVMGIPFYWRGWSGVGASGLQYGLYQPANAPSPAYTYSSQPGVAFFKELLMGGKMSNTHTDSITHSPWIYDAGAFYTGDTPASAAEKGLYVRNNGLLGAMMYSLEGDDTVGTMLKSVVSGLNGGGPAPLPSASVIKAMARTAKSSANTATNGEPINMVGGNYLATRNELTMPDKDGAVDFALSYNSAAAGQNSRVGWGWTDSYNVSAVTGDDGSVVVQNPDGRMDQYTPDGLGGFTPPQGLHDTLTTSGGAFKVTHADHSVYTFNTVGALASIISPGGNTQTLAYDSGGNLTSVTDSAGRKFTFTYTSINQIASVADPSGRTVSYTYDALGNLISVTNPAGQTTTYGYDTNHLITTVTDPRGNAVVSNVYDDQGRVTQQTNGLGNSITLAYAPGQTTYTDAQGAQTIYFSDSQMRLTKVQDPLGNITTYTYDANGNLTQSTDPLSHVTTRAYDANGNVTQLTDPAGGQQTFTYDSHNNLLTRTDQLGHVTTYAYDANNNVTQITDANGQPTKFTYDTLNELKAVIDPLNDLTGYVYDSNGNQVTKTDASNRNTYYGYDNVGRLTAVEDADGDESNYTLSPMNQVTQATDPEGHNTNYTYDADGNQTKITDANGHATGYTYDANNDLTKVTDALNQSTSYTYDKNGNLLTKTDAKGHVTTNAYDADGHLTQSTDPLGGIVKSTYDADGSLLTSTDQSNRVTSYTYDLNGNLTKVTYPDSTTTTYTYDAVGNLLTATNTAGTTTYTYDALGNMLTSTDPHNAVLTYTYNANGDLSQLEYPDGKTISYTYTPARQLSTVKDWNNAQTTYLYDNEGRLAVATLPNTIKATYTYDADSNISDLTYKKGTSAFTKYDYDYDAVGNMTDDDEHPAGGSEQYSAYTYDADNQLTKDDAPSNTYYYTYDGVGNIATSKVGSTTTNYTYNADNQLTAKGTRSFTYDPEGNEITDGTKTQAYSYSNQLKTYTSGSTTTNYIYDAQGNRIQENTGSTPSYQYVNDTNQADALALVTKNMSNSTYNYDLYGAAGLISQGGPNTTDRQYYLTDGLGNVRYLTNSSGTKLNSYSYDPYGNQTVTGSTTNSTAYQEEQRDSESGLTYLRARYYDPTTGRFLSQDPSSGTLGDPQSQNGYDYADGDPINLSDPSGATPKWLEVAEQVTLAVNPTYAPTMIFNAVAAKYGPQNINKDLGNCSYGSLTADVVVTGAMFADPEAGGEELADDFTGQVENIIFKTEHAKPHVEQIGLTSEEIESAIKDDIMNNSPPLRTDKSVTVAIKVGQNEFNYRAMILPNGKINVGTYFK